MSENSRIGFRINYDRSLPKEADIAALRSYSTCNLADGLNNFYTVAPGIYAMFPCRMAGPALTVRLRPADNLMLHKAIDLIRPGDILVVDAQGCPDYCVCGELMVSSMLGKGAAGIIVDGMVRDIAELREIGLPVFAKGTCPNVGDKTGPGEINYPVVCGGVPVHPGDVIVGDENGVVVIPIDDISQVLAGAEKKYRAEALRRDEIKKGLFVRPDIDKHLRDQGIL